MSPSTLYLVIMVVLAVLSLHSFSYLVAEGSNKNRLKFKRRSKILKIVQDSNQKELQEIGSLFEKHSLAISGKQYKTARNAVLFVFGFMWFINALLFGSSTFWGPLLVVTYILTSPRERLLSFRSPLSVGLGLYSKQHQKKRDLELYNIISQIKNIYITLDDYVSTDYVIKEMLKFSKYNRRILIKFSSLWNMNQKELAVESFVTSTGSIIGRDLAHIIDKLDGLSRDEVVEQLEVYQNSVRETKETYRAKTREIQSSMYYSVSIFLIILIILNMLITVIFNDLIEQFKLIL